jgi:hypothetical protein
VKFPETDQVPESYAGQEFSQDRRLTDPDRKVAAELGGGDDDREAQGKSTQFVELSRGARRHRQPSRKQEDCGSHQHDVNARTNSHGCASNIMAAGAARSIESGWVDVFGLRGLLLIRDIVYAILPFVPRLDPRRKNDDAFAGPYAMIRNGVVGRLFGIDAVVLLWIRASERT